MNRLNKIITFAVPCYNSAEYMDNCIQHLIDLNSEDDIEILIIDDGSDDDNTWKKAQEWEKKFPTIIHAIHQENKGHGGAVNTGLKYASGLYFKVVDSDDWLDKGGSQPVMDFLRNQQNKAKQGKNYTDMVISNFVYNKPSTSKEKEINYTNVFPQNYEFTWKDIRAFKVNQFLFMHSVIYKTSLLRDLNLSLPNNTFYVDNIFLYKPLSYVKSIFYINSRMYMYFIGREDQSVNEDIKKNRVDHQIKVTKSIIDSTDEKLLLRYPNLKKYSINYLAMMMGLTNVLLRMIDNADATQKRKDIWEYLEQKDKSLYLQVKKSISCFGTNIPTKLGRFICIQGYLFIQKFFGFN